MISKSPRDQGIRKWTKCTLGCCVFVTTSAGIDVAHCMMGLEWSSPTLSMSPILHVVRSIKISCTQHLRDRWRGPEGVLAVHVVV